MKGKNQLLVGFSGSFENITAVKAKDGDTILKGKITQMTNPNSAGQQQQRSNFTLASEAAKRLKSFLRLYFKPTHVMRHWFNEFTRHQLLVQPYTTKWVKKRADRYFAWTKGETYPLNTYEKSGASHTIAGGSIGIEVAWDYDASSQLQNGTDQIRFLVINDDTNDWLDGDSGDTRDNGETVITVNLPAQGENVVTVFALNPSTGEPTESYPLVSVDSAGTLTWKENFGDIGTP